MHDELIKKLTEENKKLKDIICLNYKALVTCKNVQTDLMGTYQTFDTRLVYQAVKQSDEIVVDHLSDKMLNAIDNFKRVK